MIVYDRETIPEDPAWEDIEELDLNEGYVSNEYFSGLNKTQQSYSHDSVVTSSTDITQRT